MTRAATGKHPRKPDPSIRGDTLHVAMTPRPHLLAVLAVVLGLWVAILLTLYFTTVYPLRHNAPATMPRAVSTP